MAEKDLSKLVDEAKMTGRRGAVIFILVSLLFFSEEPRTVLKALHKKKAVPEEGKDEQTEEEKEGKDE